MQDAASLVTVASVVAAFGSAMLVFRVQRENEMGSKNELQWLPWADRLLLGATTASLLLVIFPVVLFTRPPVLTEALPSAACAASTLALAAYPFAILAHYRFILGGGRTGPRVNPEPAERHIVAAAALLALAVFAVRLLGLTAL